MQTIAGTAMFEMQFPDAIDPCEFNQELYTKRPRIRMKLSVVVDNLVLHVDGGKTITLKKCVIEHLMGTILPVIDGDKVVMFTESDGVDQPTVVEGVR